MKAEEYYKGLDNKKNFTKLNNTGISDNLENVFEFADDFYRVKKLENQLFIGKVVEELGFEKTTKLLKESKEALL